MLMEKNCKEFIEKLASSEPVPGGGSASSFVAVLGMALGSMVCNMTIGKKKYEAVEDDIKTLLEKINRIKEELMELVEEDARNFEPLAKAYKLPKRTDEEIKHRKEFMEEALKIACSVPMKIMEQCFSAIEIFDELAQKGSKLLISDVGVGVILCKAAMQGASLNVFINTKYMDDKNNAENLNEKARNLLKLGLKRADQIYSVVEMEIV